MLIPISPRFGALGGEFTEARGPHVLLLHQHSDADASERVETLERVVLGYHLLLAAQGIEVSVPRQRLVSAWFATQKDYLAFLHTQGADAFATTRGYFHPTWNAVVAFDSRSTDEQRKGRETLSSRREELRQLTDQVDRAPARSRVKLTITGEPARTIGARRPRHSSPPSTARSPASCCCLSSIGDRSTWVRRRTR